MKNLIKTPMGFLTLAIALALVLPVLMMDGMFMDATMYTAVGHNLANGYGSPWFLYYSVTHTVNVPGFFENPPLGYWIFAVFFKVFGSSLFVERFYVLLLYLLTMPLIMKLWRMLVKNGSSISWLPVFMWSIVPLTFWAYTQNMMENTMTLFVLSAIILGLKSASATQKHYIWAALAGLCIFLAFMVKGFPGMFPLATVFIYWLVYREITFKKMLGLSICMLLFAVVPILILFALPVSGESLGYYLFVRTFERIKFIPSVDSRLSIVFEMLQQIILPVIVIGISLLIYKPKTRSKLAIQKKAFWFLLLLGLCGVLPLCLTKVQRGFYLIPAIPVIAMALAVVIAEPTRLLQQSVKGRAAQIIYSIASVIFLGTIISTVILAGTPKREKELLADVNTIGTVIGKHDTITAPAVITQNWEMKAYFMRYYFIQLDHSAMQDSTLIPEEWMLIGKNQQVPFPFYQKQDVKLNLFDLYRKEE